MPEAAISRQDMLVILNRALAKLGITPSKKVNVSIDSFNDSRDIAVYAKEAVKLFVGTGMISGSGKNLSPKANATRAEVAAVLYRLLLLQ